MIDALLEPDVEEYITCDICGGEIYKGYNYWNFDNEIYCEHCKDSHLSELANECEEVYDPKGEY